MILFFFSIVEMSTETKLISAEDAKGVMELYRSKKHLRYEDLTEEQKFNLTIKKVMSSIRSSSSGGVHYVDAIVKKSFYKRIFKILRDLGYTVRVLKYTDPSCVDLQIIWGER